MKGAIYLRSLAEGRTKVTNQEPEPKVSTLRSVNMEQQKADAAWSQHETVERCDRNRPLMTHSSDSFCMEKPGQKETDVYRRAALPLLHAARKYVGRIVGEPEDSAYIILFATRAQLVFEMHPHLLKAKLKYVYIQLETTSTQGLIHNQKDFFIHLFIFLANWAWVSNIKPSKKLWCLRRKMFFHGCDLSSTHQTETWLSRSRTHCECVCGRV